MAKRVYFFKTGTADGSRAHVDLLGSKGAHLAEMCRLDVPVPPGFTITTQVCREFYESDQHLPAGLTAELDDGVERLQNTVGRKLGNAKDPLLVSVRSGAAFSMPGMMDTVLNLGMSETAVSGLIETSGNERFAWDTFRRFIQMFGNVVLGVPHEEFEALLSKKKKEAGVLLDSDLSPEDLKIICRDYRRLVESKIGESFPEDPRKQLRMAIEAVFRSWHNRRARSYRRLHGIPDDLGTAVTVQAMVFGNRGKDSGTGVCFTRDPATGKRIIMGEYLINAQGEDVVAGIRTPHPINASSRQPGQTQETLEEWNPSVYDQLRTTVERLERHYTDMQDIEFTIENGKLWILQTRRGKRTAHAAVHIAVDLVHEGIADRKAAISRVEPVQVEQLLHPTFDPAAKREVLAKGLPASPGAVSGRIVFSASDAEHEAKRGEKVILVRAETSPEDIDGMHAAVAILTSRGGMTSHAAVVARGMGKCCVVGCGELHIDEAQKTIRLPSGETLRERDVISLDGATGELLRGQVAVVKAQITQHFAELMSWADEVRKLGIRVNADTPADCKVARDFGAEGVGLCRTEHMFFDKARIDIVRQMILSEDENERKTFLDQILPMQLDDFCGIFETMRGLPVTIRLLDPPLHEFLPQHEKEITTFAMRTRRDAKDLRNRIDRLRELNPMLGHRGCRLGITFPDIYEMQVKAIMLAACQVSRNLKEPVYPEIMVPLVSDPREFFILQERIVSLAENIRREEKSSIKFLVGTMIEIPRAALLAGEIAKKADFFSFGTNDLTQTTFGLSRDDSGRFLPQYIESGILTRDPFASLDSEGVLELVKIGTERGRKANPHLKVGVCGEHGGDPESIRHFHNLGLEYVSCSPYRIPLARLRAAQVALPSAEHHS